MEGKNGRWQDWVQLAAIFGVGITIWLNVPTKGDIKSLRDEIKSELEKVATKEEMRKGFDDVKINVSNLRREVDDVKTDVRANNQNHVNHLAKHGK
ncbi:MAG: hypothetical protein OXN17_17155 [Candidatus Poribacteria bacterium]|nr:hypothetical protein [Candidatus Poribacteria bacterium]MDE0502945.1 hypothetical protein [Candidatus Poribacteria bacterium]